LVPKTCFETVAQNTPTILFFQQIPGEVEK
jgi:hypothetical protein